MSFHFQTYDSWRALNKELKNHLQLENSKTDVQVYRGLHHALLEITQGLVKLFPHKKQVLYLKDVDPYVEGPVKALAKEGFKVSAIKKDEIHDGLKDKVGKETLFFLYASDMPITGGLLPTDIIFETLKDEKVFRVELSNGRHECKGFSKDLDRYQVRILNLSSDLALAFLGDRAKIMAPVASGLYWPSEIAGEITGLLEQKTENAKKVLEFEAEGAGGFKPLFQKDEPRLYDRAVFYWEDMDGYAFIHEMAKELDFELLAPGEESRIETASLSRWGGVRTMDWLKNYGLTENQIRGLVCVKASLIKPDFSQKVVSVREKILEMQNG